MTEIISTKRAQWMSLLAAFLGWMFDGFEMGLFPLIGQPALSDLLGPDAPSGDATVWFGTIIAVFLVGAATGGVVFGWLGDKIGRVRSMSLSILTYAVFTGLCGFATEAWQIAVLRFIASLGMGGEWSLGVALVNEIWPGKSRALVAGLIGAAANIGFLIVGVLSIVLTSFISGVESAMLFVGLSQSMTDMLLGNSVWRFLMISGAFPALLVFFIRLFVPESARWERENRPLPGLHRIRAFPVSREYALRTALPGRRLSRGRHDRLLLRILSALPSGAVSDGGTGDRPGIRL